MRYFNLLAVTLVLVCGCSSAPPQAATKTASGTAPALAGLPVTVTLKQRSNQVIPGSDGVRLTVDDVTRNQVMASVSAKDGTTLLGPISLARGASAEFTLGRTAYTLTLKELNNALVGDDFATFVITGPAGVGLSEKEKIERLLAHVERLEGAKFVRNGAEHSAKEAAGHLRTKWSAAGDRVTTARQFVDHLATKSSTSDEPYAIKLPDGTTRPAGQYLHERLAELEKGK